MVQVNYAFALTACFGWSPDVVKEADPVYNDVSVVRTGGSTGAISVEFTTSAQTATPGIDYTETIGTFNWDDGEILCKARFPFLFSMMPWWRTLNISKFG